MPSSSALPVASAPHSSLSELHVKYSIDGQQPTNSNPYGRASFQDPSGEHKDYDESLDTLDNKDRDASVHSQARLTTPTQQHPQLL